MNKITFLKGRIDQRGGLEKYTLRLMRAFATRGYRVTLLTTGHPSKIEGVEVISLARDSKFTLYQLTHFDHLCQKWLKEHPQEMIFGMERTTYQTHYRAGNGVHAVYLKRRALIESKLKTVSFSLNPLHRQLLKMEKKAFEHPKLKTLFTNSQMVKDEILSLFTTAAEKVHVVHNGVEWHEWEEAFESTFQHKREEPFHFLFVGNDYRRKGLLFLLQGLHLLKQEDFLLTVIGRNREKAFFERAVEKLNLKKHVRFLGPQSEIRPFFKEADVLVIPSIYDPFANVTVEALAMGLFVVSSRFNGGHEILTDQTGAIIEEITSPESVAKTLKHALSYPKTEERARLIRQSIKELDFSNQLDKIVAKCIS